MDQFFCSKLELQRPSFTDVYRFLITHQKKLTDEFFLKRVTEKNPNNRKGNVDLPLKELKGSSKN